MPELDDPHCPKCRHDAATCPGVRGPPLKLQPSGSFFCSGEFRTTCLPLSRVTNTKVEHRSTCHRGYHHRYTLTTETDPCGPPYSVDPRFFSPLLKTGHPTLHTLSPPSPVITRSVSRKAEAAVDACADPDANAGSAERPQPNMKTIRCMIGRQLFYYYLSGVREVAWPTLCSRNRITHMNP